MTTMENPQPDTSDPGNELTAEATEHAEIFSDAPDTENGHLERAYKLQEEDDFKAALQACSQAIEDVPTLVEAHNLRGLLLEQLGRPEQAIEAYRRAVELDAEFEEARQNFQELQEELQETSYRRTRVNPLKVILTGAGAYSILYVLAHFILSVIDSGTAIIESYLDLLLLPLYAFIYACVIGLCAFIIGEVARFKQALRLGIASGLGYLVAYMITLVITIFTGRFVDYLFSFHTATWYSVVLVKIITSSFAQYAIIGAITGLCFGLVQKTRTQIIYSILAGVIGFSLQRAIEVLYMGFFTSIKWLVPIGLNDLASDTIIAILLYTGLFIKSSPIGALFGYVLTRYRPPALEASDLGEATAAASDAPQRMQTEDAESI